MKSINFFTKPNEIKFFEFIFETQLKINENKKQIISILEDKNKEGKVI